MWTWGIGHRLWAPGAVYLGHAVTFYGRPVFAFSLHVETIQTRSLAFVLFELYRHLGHRLWDAPRVTTYGRIFSRLLAFFSCNLL